MRVVLKLTPVMVDPRINSKQEIARNIYNAGLFMAFRFCAYVKSFFPSKKMNQRYLVECVKRGGKAVKSRVDKAFISFYQGKVTNFSLQQFIFLQRQSSPVRLNNLLFPMQIVSLQDLQLSFLSIVHSMLEWRKVVVGAGKSCSSLEVPVTKYWRPWRLRFPKSYKMLPNLQFQSHFLLFSNKCTDTG